MEMDFSSQNPATSNALSLAARNNDVNNVARLLKKCNPNCVDNRGWTCLHEAAYSDSYESMMLILNNRHTRGLTETHEGHTALYLACKNNCSIKTVKALLESVDDIANYGSTEGVTPLHIASAQGNVELIELLLQYGAILNVQDFDGDTPLHEATLGVQHGALVVLLYAGADVGIGNTPGGFTAFHLACCRSYLPNVKSLFPFITDINEPTASGDTPLHIALRGGYGNGDIVYFLLENGADPNTKNKTEQMPLDMALGGDPDIFKKLLSVTDREKINVNLLTNACKPHRFKFCILETILNSNLGPEYFNVVNIFNTLINKSLQPQSIYLTHSPLNIYLYVCGYIYKQSPEKFREFFYLFLMQGVNVNPLHSIECPPLVYAQYVYHTDDFLDTTCFNEVFQILIEMGCNVDYYSERECLANDVYISDSFRTATDIYPHSAILMMPYSLYNEPVEYLKYAQKNNLFTAMPTEVHEKFLTMIDKNFTGITPDCIDYHVPCLKHLCRYRIRSFFRFQKIYKNNIKMEHTTSTFLNLINNLPVPTLIKNYLRYIDN